MFFAYPLQPKSGLGLLACEIRKHVEQKTVLRQQSRHQGKRASDIREVLDDVVTKNDLKAAGCKSLQFFDGINHLLTQIFSPVLGATFRYLEAHCIEPVLSQLISSIRPGAAEVEN